MFLSEHIQNEVVTINSEHVSSEGHFERKFQAKIFPSDKSFEKKEEELIEFKGKQHDEFRKLLSGTIQNELLTLTSEHPTSIDHFERKFQANIYPPNKSLEKQEEELIEFMINIQEFKVKYHDILRNFSSEPIQNEVRTPTSETSLYKDFFERKFESKLSTSIEISEQPEE